MPSCAGSLAGKLAGLLARTDEYLVDIDILRLGDGVDDSVGDILALQRCDAPNPFLDLASCLQVGDIALKFRCDGTRLDDGDADIVRQDLLPQRF